MYRAKLKTKYAYDLGVWYSFYENCHKLEETFLKDDGLRKCSDYHSPNYPGDVTKRTLSWNEEEIFRSLFYDALKHEYADEKYKEYVKANEDEESGRKKGVVFTAIGAVALVLMIVNLCMVIYGSRYQYPNMVIVGAIVLAIAFSVNLIQFITFMKKRQAMVTKHGEDKMVNKVQSFQSWFDQNFKEKEPWVSHYYDALNRFQKKAREGIDSQERKEDVETLIQARKYLESMIDLPEEYTDEFHIRILFSLYLLGKADSLESGVEKLKDELVVNDIQNQPMDFRVFEERFTFRIEKNRINEDPELLKSLEPNRFIFHYMEEHLHLHPYPITFEDIQA